MKPFFPRVPFRSYSGYSASHRKISVLIPVLIAPLIWIICQSFLAVNCYASPTDKPDFVEVARSISRIIADNHYNPKELQNPKYIALNQNMLEAARTVNTKDEFTDVFNQLWRDGPFSHVNLVLSDRNAADTADFYDTFNVGGGGARLDWDSDVAVLTVNTMMGMDTIAEITTAYSEIVAKDAKALIIDLRNNPGGAFAIVPLIGHLITEPLAAGTFTSRQWHSQTKAAPTSLDLVNLSSWTGWSIKSFWRDVQAAPLTPITFLAMAPYYKGPVYILTSGISASATEFATDALANLPKVTIIGETTAGKMLSQKMFDVSEGFQLSLPIADYYSKRMGRIEGKGVSPDIVVPAQAAMSVAMGVIGGADPKAITQEVLRSADKDSTLHPQETLYLFGSMNNWGKNWGKTPKLTYRGNGIYEAKITFQKGRWEFKAAPMNWSYDYGASEKDIVIHEGHAKPVIKKPGSHNLVVSIKDDSEYTVRLYLNDTQGSTLLLEKEN